MDIRELVSAPLNAGPLGGRQHRFMESADINAAFRELFVPLRANVRRGLSNEGQVYGLEMDSHVPGELLATEWIPIASRGVSDAGTLTDPATRRTLFDRLLRETRPEALFAYIAERGPAHGPSTLYLEIVSADAGFAAEYPICAGEGWHVRDLLKAPHRKLDPVTLE
jgi:hypothetical protein